MHKTIPTDHLRLILCVVASGVLMVGFVLAAYTIGREAGLHQSFSDGRHVDLQQETSRRDALGTQLAERRTSLKQLNSNASRYDEGLALGASSPACFHLGCLGLRCSPPLTRVCDENGCELEKKFEVVPLRSVAAFHDPRTVEWSKVESFTVHFEGWRGFFQFGRVEKSTRCRAIPTTDPTDRVCRCCGSTFHVLVPLHRY